MRERLKQASVCHRDEGTQRNTSACVLEHAACCSQLCWQTPSPWASAAGHHAQSSTASEGHVSSPPAEKGSRFSLGNIRRWDDYVQENRVNRTGRRGICRIAGGLLYIWALSFKEWNLKRSCLAARQVAGPTPLRWQNSIAFHPWRSGIRSRKGRVVRRK